MTNELQTTPEQEAALEAIAEGRPLAVNARAGSGKTWLLVEAANRNRLHGTAVAFNKKNATDLQTRMPSSMRCKTLHSTGMNNLRAMGVKLQVNKKKNWELLEQVEGSGEDGIADASFVKAIGQFKSGMYPTDMMHAGQALALASNTEPSDEEVERLLEAIKMGNQWLKNGVIDFDDMLYGPWLMGTPWQKQRLVMVDEAQDLNPIQHWMYGQMLATDKFRQPIVIGDPYQAIYGWRGAVSGSMGSLVKAHGLEQTALTVSFRCPEAVAEYVRQWVGDFNAMPSAPEGEVAWRQSWRLDDIGPQDAVICRVNAPLIRVALRMLMERRPFNLMGGEALTGVVGMMRKHKRMLPKAFAKVVQEWYDKTMVWYRAKGVNASRIEDMKEVLDLFCEQTEFGSVADMLATLQKLQRSGAGPTLCSGHKSKGAEWDTVWHLDSERIEEFADRAERKDEEHQEWNIAYVISTRAKRRLLHVRLDELED